MTCFRLVKLIIVHYHFRPGGVRRVIESAVPDIVLGGGKFSSVVLATGEAPDPAWLREFRRLLSPAKVKIVTLPALSYFSEQQVCGEDLPLLLESGLDVLLQGADTANCLIWAHNTGLGRNLMLTSALARRCAELHIPLLLHHHDWWFENRWQRWPEFRRCGFPTLDSVAAAVFPVSDKIRHITINREDTAILQKYFGQRVRWLPNPVASASPPTPARLRFAHRWLADQVGSDAPVWILPCRLLRRKNIGEALLLTRWLRPDAWLVTTGGVSSADEESYAARLRDAAQANSWHLRLGLLSGNGKKNPSVPELMAASEVVLLTSIQEGFGLPNLEAVAAGRPLIARRLTNVAPDLAGFGFRFPQSYDEILIAPELFDWAGEVRRQAELFRKWRFGLPRSCRALAGEPMLSAQQNTPRPVPFSRLTLTAQLEVLCHPVENSWNLCAPLNPFLPIWKKRAATQSLSVTPWPGNAEKWLGAPAYADKFWKFAGADSRGSSTLNDSRAAQKEFLRARLNAAALFPLLWEPSSVS
ncbi:MAG: glycosyltransferase [Terrimicrobiaceae bacterium]